MNTASPMPVIPLLSLLFMETLQGAELPEIHPYSSREAALRSHHSRWGGIFQLCSCLWATYGPVSYLSPTFCQ